MQRASPTLLRALRIAAGAYLLQVPGTRNWSIKKDEVRQTNKKLLLEHRPTIIEAEGSFSGIEHPIKWRRRLLEGSSATTSSAADVGSIRRLGKAKYERMMREEADDLDLPLIGYFGTNRVHGAARNRASTRVGRQIFKEGYYSWFDLRSSTYAYKRWLETYDALVVGGKEYEESKQVFFNTIKTACPYVKRIAFVKDQLWLIVNMFGEDSDFLPLELMSDGIITFVELVAELAYRCIVLNGYQRENTVKETKGIVLIDELDLHLHPKWQKHVVDDLKLAFPKVQFISTTHSPLIVQSLRDAELINLDDSEAHRGLEEDPFKYSLEEVVEDEMGVEQAHRSKRFQEMQQAAANFFNMVAAGKNEGELAEVKQKLDELRLLFNHDPAYVALLESELKSKS